jgi:ribonuclease VapC
MHAALVVDSSALAAVLLEEPDALDYAQALYDADELRMTAPNWLETAQAITGRLGTKGYQQFHDLTTRLRIEVIACDALMARASYEAWLRYGKGRHPAALNFGDCFSYALAKLRAEPLLF